MSILIQPPRVPLVDPRTGTIATEWFRYFRDIQDRVGGVNGVLALAPTSSTDNAIVRFDGTNGDQLQNSSVTISDAGALTGATIDASTNTITTAPSGGLVATELNAALAELEAEIAAIPGTSTLKAFAAAYG